MEIKAIFHRKEPELDLKNCSFDRVVVLPDSKYQRFLKNMLGDYDFIDQYRDEMYQEGDIVHCILVKGENSTDGILVNSEGGSYARYAAYFPAVDLFLKDQQLKQEAQPQRREITQEELAQMYAEHIQWQYGPQGTGKQAEFSDCVLSGLDMRGMRFQNAIFWNTVLEQMDMQGTSACYGEFQGAKFINCNMERFRADEADFTDCSFEGCNLKNANLPHRNLTNARFQDTILDGADLRWSCLEGMEALQEAVAQANTQDVSFDERDWFAQVSPDYEPTIEMGGM